LKFAIYMAKKISKNSKRDHAFMLYTRDGIVSYKALSDRTGASAHSISRWCKDEGWEKYRQNMLLTREEQMQNLLVELTELNESIKLKEKGSRYADSKEADIRRKLIKDIKELETKASVSEIIETARRFIRWIMTVDADKGKEVTNLFDAFIKDCLR
jgi:hypothetical protein